jgi:S-layer homology domain
MKRLARLLLASSLALAVLCATNQAALATPFSDVPANHWAYQYIQSLAADGLIDGYPDGKFKGDRPLTRYEMAVIVARVVAKLQENQYKGPSKEDLDKLQKLIDALKDELDALGVRVTNLEDALDALDKRTKFAQSLSMHGVFLPNVSWRQRYDNPESIYNETGSSVTTYYGGTAANGHNTTIDPFVNAFISTDDSNNPLTQNGSGFYIRQDSHFALAYQITDKLTLSLPVHILNYEYGSDDASSSRIDFEPSVEINLASVGAFTNVDMKFGLIDNMPSSRTGLTFRAPYGDSAGVPYEEPYQPTQKGASFSTTLNEGTFGSLSMWGSLTRLDQTMLNTQTGVTDPNVLNSGAVAYLFPIVAPQAGWTAAGAAAALKTDTFNAGSGTLTQVYLTSGAVLGSAYVSFYNGTTYNSAGAVTGGPGAPLPAITYNQAYNSIVFGTPLGAGSVVSITYRAISVTQNTNYQRYMINARLNQKFKVVPGLEVGVSYNRIYDYDDLQTTGDLTYVNQAATTGYGLVSDSVLGIDGQYALPFQVSGAGSEPVLFGEAAGSKFTPDYRNVAAVGDTAGIVGLKLKFQKIQLSLQYQNVGPNFIDGAPTQYFGNAPQLFSFWKGNYLPGFYGFGNSQAINNQFDSSFGTTPVASPKSGVNPNLTFAYPLFNPLVGTGTQYFQAFTPNTQGITIGLNTPVRIGDLSFTTNAQYQNLQQLRPNSEGAQIYGPAYQSNSVMKFQVFTAGIGFSVPVYGQSVGLNISGGVDTLKQPDMTAYQYYPINPTTQTFDAQSYITAQAAFPGGTSPTLFYPNYVNMTHYFINARATIPVARDLLLIGYYSTQHYYGEYGTTLTQDINERKEFYSGTLQYNIPKTNSAVSFVARHQDYIDNYVSTYNFAQNRQDINFTVRF